MSGPRGWDSGAGPGGWYMVASPMGQIGPVKPPCFRLAILGPGGKMLGIMGTGL